MALLVDKIISILFKYKIIHEENEAWVRYGLYRRLSTLFVFIPFFLLAVVLTDVYCASSFICGFFFMRSKTNGYHAKSFILCFTYSLLLELIFLLLIYPLLTPVVCYIVSILCALNIFFLAPFNHPNMNYSATELRACRVQARIRVLLCQIIIIVAQMLRLESVSKGLTLAIALVAFMLTIAYITTWRKNYENKCRKNA